MVLVVFVMVTEAITGSCGLRLVGSLARTLIEFMGLSSGCVIKRSIRDFDFPLK